MIPIRVTHRSSTTPIVTGAFALACLATFLRLATMPEDLASGLLRTLAVVPSVLLRLPPDPEQWLTLVTASFLHASALHLAGNMLYLVVFGPAAEDRLGHARFSAVYLISGAAGLVAHAATHASSPTPVVGASASIAGVLGAYLVLLPRSKVTTVIPAFFTLEFASLPAAFLVAAWFLLQLAGAAAAAGSASDTAWLAHIGGFVSGAALAAGATMNQVGARRRT